MRISKEVIKTIEKQFALDCNLEEAKEIKPGEIYLSKSKSIPGGRIAADTDLFFRAIIFMGKAYLMADESIYAGCEEVFKDASADWFCKFPNLRLIDRIVSDYDHEIADTHIYFLPDEDAPFIREEKRVQWFDEQEIAAMKETNIFHHALCYSKTQPDFLAVAAVDENGNRKGMAGASLDGEYVRQIGIDVLSEYRGEGLATYLTSLIKQKIWEMGKLPFYGTSESHSISRSVAIHAGFLPAWAEIYVKPKTNEKKGRK